jgi:two-component system alkaline phosphatase synthesis response regulator PhoP
MEIHRILVCDDEPHIVHVVAAKLSNAGFTVITAGDGEEAFELATIKKPDLVITDYQMPHLSGLELCAKLRGDASTRQIPAIMLTARGFSLSDQELSHTNIRRVLVKPFSPREVLSTVRQILDGTKTPKLVGSTTCNQTDNAVRGAL